MVNGVVLIWDPLGYALEGSGFIFLLEGEFWKTTKEQGEHNSNHE